MVADVGCVDKSSKKLRAEGNDDPRLKFKPLKGAKKIEETRPIGEILFAGSRIPSFVGLPRNKRIKTGGKPFRKESEGAYKMGTSVRYAGKR